VICTLLADSMACGSRAGTGFCARSADAEFAESPVARGGGAESHADVNVAPVKRIALKYEAAKLLNLRLFIGIYLAVEVCYDIVRSFCHRDAVFFTRPAPQVNHLATFGAERLPLIVFPTCLSTALRASSNCRVTHQSSENYRGRASGVRNANNTEFCGKIEREFAEGVIPAMNRRLRDSAQPPLQFIRPSSLLLRFQQAERPGQRTIATAVPFIKLLRS